MTFFNKRVFAAIWFGLLAPTRFIPLSKSPSITELIGGVVVQVGASADGDTRHGEADILGPVSCHRQSIVEIEGGI